MSKRQDKVVIKEPPMQELNKKRSCLWRTTVTGCGCILIFLLAGMLLIRFATKPNVKKIKNLPAEISELIPLYDKESIETIKFTAGEDRGKAIERAAFIPKVLLAPILVTLENTSATSITFADLKQAIREPIADHRDLVQIEWSDLHAKADFISKWYLTELKNKGFEVNLGSQTELVRQISFEKQSISGSVFMRDDPDTPDTDYVIVTINIP